MKQEPVSRLRRSLFVFAVTFFCLNGALYLAISEKDGKVAEIVADGFITIPLALSISYVAGTSIDYSGVLNRIGGGRGLSVASSQPAKKEDEDDGEDKPATPTADKPKSQNPGDDPDLAKG